MEVYISGDNICFDYCLTWLLELAVDGVDALAFLEGRSHSDKLLLILHCIY